jgi:hypothetical protein
MPNRNSETQPKRFRCAWAGMVEWSPDVAIAIPHPIPIRTSRTAAWKLKDDAFMVSPDVRTFPRLDFARFQIGFEDRFWQVAAVRVLPVKAFGPLIQTSGPISS